MQAAPSGTQQNGKQALAECSTLALCSYCEADQNFLRLRVKPKQLNTSFKLRVVDLFAGCGGMSIGLEEAARRAAVDFEVALAVDNDADVIGIFERNVPCVDARVADVHELFDGALGSPLTGNETSVAHSVGIVGMLVGGPPCQGHSDLNNHTRRRDPKNALYLRMARAAEVLQPKLVVVENVSAVQWDEGQVVRETITTLERNGYAVATRVLDLAGIGVPQRRRRFLLLASQLAAVEPVRVLARIGDFFVGHAERTVQWAIHDLLTLNTTDVFNSSSKPTERNRQRIQYLFEHGCFDLPNDQRPQCHRDGDHSYNSVYGRLRWNKAAQTITTGFGCMGQGRYVHPQRRRTITPHEAARLQTFPDWFDFGDARRGVLAKTIGNAVPPLLTIGLGAAVIEALVTDGRPQP